ncbi:uncharacterized protein LOC115316791 [Ixodes scapularis]|uniref:uncharacterized protein LOC115316791 n=1 Tax=Ixodes scapularis TaxID=6945 RepID=UPI001A9CC97E|nr:uncharacterized protein LOC115316791 [Ixodes scapularis]
MWTSPSILGFLALVVVLGADQSSGSCQCDEAPLRKFDIQALLRCGGNSMAYSILEAPGSPPHCQLDAIDQDRDGNLICYMFSEGGICSRTPHTYYSRGGISNPNALSRDLGGCAMTKSLIVDTDNCNYLVHTECYANGSVYKYLTYKESWPRASRDAYIRAAVTKFQISYIKDYSIDCENGIP